MPLEDKVSAGKRAVADHAVATALATLAQEEAPPARPTLDLTNSEVEDIDLLCYALGAGRNACINFATKYFSSMLLHSTVDLKLPRPLKPSKRNPPAAVEYKLNPEVTAALAAAPAKRKPLQTVPEKEIVTAAVLHLCKKLLPAKRRRLAIGTATGEAS